MTNSKVKKYVVVTAMISLVLLLAGCSLFPNDEKDKTATSNTETEKVDDLIDKDLIGNLSPYTSDYAFKDMEPDDNTLIMQIYLDGNTDWNKTIVNKLNETIENKELENVAIEIYDINDEATRSNNGVAQSQYDANKEDDASRTYGMLIDLKEQTQISYTNLVNTDDLNNFIKLAQDESKNPQ